MSVDDMVNEARKIIRKLNENGHAAYFVGGYVRDLLFGRTIRDIDIATSAHPRQVMELFPHTVPTGLKHGTVTVVVKPYTFEVTTFRTESNYEDFRHPKEVRFVSDIKGDLQRRDFTINAIAMDADGNLIDPFGGREDIRNKILRAVGDPAARFGEDALRMLRCIRIAAEYGLSIDPETWKALVENRHLLKHIAMERVREELDLVVSGSRPLDGIRLLLNSGLPGHFKADPGFGMEVWNKLDGRLEGIERITEPDLRWTYLFVSMGLNSDTAKSALRKFTFPVRRIKRIAMPIACAEWLAANCESLAAHGEWLAEQGKAQDGPVEELRGLWKRGAVRFGIHCMEDWLSVYKLTGWEPKVFLQHGAEWLSEIKVFTLKQLAVDGNDLLALRPKDGEEKGGEETGKETHSEVRYGKEKGGEWIGIILDKLLEEAALGRVENSKERLIERAKELLERGDLA